MSANPACVALLSFAVASLLASPALARMPGAPATSAFPAEKVRGFDLEALARATAKSTAFSTEYGTAQGAVNFEVWLHQQGFSLADYDAAYSAFLDRFSQDKSGGLEQSYFKALDLYTAGEQPAPLEENRALPELARESRRSEVDAAFTADAWQSVEQVSVLGQAADQQEKFGQILAESQARASAAFLALEESTAQKYGPQFASLRAGQLPGGGTDSASLAEDRSAAPAPPVPPPAGEGAIAALYAALRSNRPDERRAAARPFAWECDHLAAAPASAAEGEPEDPRQARCGSLVLRDLWLPVVWEIFDAAPEAELDRVAPLLPYLAAFDFAGESRLSLESLRDRLREEETAAIARLAAAERPAEKIFLRARCGGLRSTLSAVEAALAAAN